MVPVRPVRWAVVAVAFLAAACTADPPAPAPPEPAAAPPAPSAARTPADPPPPAADPPPPPPSPSPSPWAAAPPAAAPRSPWAPTPGPAPAPPPRPAPGTIGTGTAAFTSAPQTPGTTPPETLTPPKQTDQKDQKEPEPEKPKWPATVNGRSLGEWLNDFKSTDPSVRDYALKVIPLFGPDARKTASKEIINLILKDPDPGIKINAMLILGTVGCETKEEMRAAARAMATAIENTRPGSMIRLHAARMLAALGPDGHEAIGAVNSIANDPSWETRQAVAAALGRLGAPVYDDKPPLPGSSAPPAMKRPPNKAAMDKLVFALLKDDSSAVRLEAMQSMIVLGPPHTKDPAEYPKVIARYLEEIALRQKLEKDHTVKIWLYLVEMMYDDRAIEGNIHKIAEYLNSDDNNQRLQALNALAVVGPLARPALGEIIDCLKHPDPERDVPVAAIYTLLAMREAARYALDDLVKLEETTKDEDLKRLFGEAIKYIREGKTELEQRKKDDPKKKK
jgi:HEAT repeat protein